MYLRCKLLLSATSFFCILRNSSHYLQGHKRSQDVFWWGQSLEFSPHYSRTTIDIFLFFQIKAQNVFFVTDGAAWAALTADVMWLSAVLCASAGLVAGLHTKQQPFYSVSVQPAITGRRQDTLALKHHCVTLKITAAGKARLQCPECRGASYLSNHIHTDTDTHTHACLRYHPSDHAIVFGDKMQGAFLVVQAFLLKVKAVFIPWYVSTLVSFYQRHQCPKPTKSAGQKRIFLAL